MEALYRTGKRPPVGTDRARVALVGLGNFGRFCLEAYRRAGDIEVTVVADPNVTAAALGEAHGTRLVPDWHSLLDDPSIEAVHLLTPPHLRGAIAVPLLRSGKAVFCEKPLALSLEEADEMIAASHESGAALSIDYVLRHHPAYALLDRLTSSGLMGPLSTFSLQNFAQALPANHWMWDAERSGGILVEHGVHFFDAYSRIAGRATEIRGHAFRPRAVTVEVTYDTDAIGLYYHEFAFPQAVERTVGIAAFERGSIEIDGWIPESLRGRLVASCQEVRQALRHAAPEIAIWRHGPTTHVMVRFEERSRAYAGAVVEGMRQLIARHRDGEAPMAATAGDARHSLALALAGDCAVRAGRTVAVKDG